MIRPFKFFALLGFLGGVAGSPTFASVPALSACDAPIDLREPGGSMDGIGPTTQGYHSNNLCGFFAFGTYLDSYRIGRDHEDGATMVRTNPVEVGVEDALRADLPYWFPVQNSTDPLVLKMGRWGATFCALAKSVKEIGYCADDSIPTKGNDPTAKFVDITMVFYTPLLEIAGASASRRDAMIAEKLADLYPKYIAWATDQNIALVDQATIRALILKNPTKPYETIRSIFFPHCAEVANRHTDFTFGVCKSELYLGLDATGIPTKNQDPLRTDRAARRVADLLTRPNALPVPFAYCSAVLVEGKKYRGYSPVAANQCGIHWSLVAGRKRIGSDCYLLVHNTWGPKAKYSNDWIVDQAHGDIWVREQELTRAMLLVQWLED
jgi:hypothetical protein